MTERRDHGFTLPEVLIVTLLLGLVVTVIAAAFTVIVRTSPSAKARDDDSRTLLGLTNYLPADVSSTRLGDILIGDQDTSCGAQPGTGVLYLTWTDFGSGQKTEVTYRFADVSGWRIVRDHCVGGTLTTLRMSSIVSEDGTNPVTVATMLLDHDGDPSTAKVMRGVSVRTNTLNGTTQQVDAISDNVLENLSPVVVTSSTSTTLLPPAPNNAPVAQDLTFEAWNTEATDQFLPATDPDGDTLTASIDPAFPLPADWSVSFTDLQITITPDPAAALGTYQFGYRVQDNDPDDPLFDSGLVNITIVDTSVGTTTTTTIPCSVSSVGVAPSTVENGNPSVARLKDAVTVTIVKSGACTNLILAFAPDQTPPSPTVVELSFTDGTQITIGKNDYSWSDGAHVLRVRQGSGGAELANTT